MPVTMEIVQSCVVRASDLDFGAYRSNSAAAVLGQTTLELHCSAGQVAEIALDSGTGIGGGTTRRRMRQEPGGDKLDYDLYQDAGRTVHWGDRSGNDTVEVPTSGNVQTLTIYGKIPASQRVRDGSYSDEITVSVFY
ncbi:spore coat U domain-containing protein [uncultured Ramlibacter sp.]|uniref:Csu type fimbrial protein n=1 Tax=uncultured Ramlibacter sp. TaxID=260755 RepID=UPI002625BF0E|nr:spore coat U domain-containing protein [uncultured Ramlibacter sp.]